MVNYKKCIALVFLLFSSSVFATDYMSDQAVKARKDYEDAMKRRHEQVSGGYETKKNTGLPENLKKQFEAMNKSATGTATIAKNEKTFADVAKQMAKRGAKGLVKGGAYAYAGQLAVDQILKGVDYVLDPENNTVKKKFSNNGISCGNSGETCEQLEYIWVVNAKGYSGSTYQAGCSSFVDYLNSYNPNNNTYSIISCDLVSEDKAILTFSYDKYTKTTDIRRIRNSNYSKNNTLTLDEFQSLLQKSINDYMQQHQNDDTTNTVFASAYEQDPLDDTNELHNKLANTQQQAFDTLKNSDKNSVQTESQDHSVIVDMNFSSDFQLGDNPYTSSNDTNTDTSTGTNTDTSTGTNTDTSTGTGTLPSTNTQPQTSTDSNLPPFCTWASTMCEWYYWTKTKYDDVEKSVKEFFEEKEKEDTEIEIEDEQEDVDTNIDFGGSCPVPIDLVNTTFMGTPIYVQFDFSVWCDPVETYIRPIVILLGMYFSALIVGGVKTHD